MMEGTYSEKYSFVGEWYDSQAGTVRRFNIFFYPSDDTLEMFDLKNRKTFVRRVKVNGIHLDNFYIGCTITILGRLVKIVDFACEYTKNKLSKDIQVAFAIIKPVNTKTAGQILTHLCNEGLRVAKLKMTRLSNDDVNELLSEMSTDSTFPFLMEYMCSDSVYGMELIGKDAINTCMKAIGDKDPKKAETGTIRAIYGTDTVKNCIHYSTSTDNALKNIEYFFTTKPTRLGLTAKFNNSTLCIVKPHSLREGNLGNIISAIDEGGFNITALNMFMVENINAAEFYEVYKGIVPEYKGMVEELSSGLCVAMEVTARKPNDNTVTEFRKLVGPSDPEIARLLRPHTLRARFGHSKVKNAVHCSDLPEDGLLEVEYFFKILDV